MKKYQHIDVDSIEADEEQARDTPHGETVRNIAKTFEDTGQILPVEVTTDHGGEKEYRLVSGEQRWNAAKLNGWGTIEAKVVNGLTEEQRRDRQLIENLHRKDLTTVEKGEGMVSRFSLAGIEYDTLESLASDCDATRRCKADDNLPDRKGEGKKYDRYIELDAVMERVGVNGQQVARWIRNANVTEYVQEEQKENEEPVATTTIVELSSRIDTEEQNEVYDHIREQGMSVARAKQYLVTVEEESEELREAVEGGEINNYHNLSKVRNMDVDDETKVETWETIRDEDMTEEEAKAEIERWSPADESEEEEEDTQTVEVSKEAAETLNKVAESSGTSTTEVMDTVVAGPTEEHETDTVEEPQHVVATEVEDKQDAETPNGKTFEEIDKRRDAIDNHASSVELGNLKENWDAYGHAISHISNARCPEEGCDNGIEHLTWDCHGHNVAESYIMSQETYEKAIEEAPEIKEILKEMDGFQGYEYDAEYEARHEEAEE